MQTKKLKDVLEYAASIVAGLADALKMEKFRVLTAVEVLKVIIMMVILFHFTVVMIFFN